MEKRTVLFVDDEEKILTSLKRGLLDEPYNTLFANSGKEALQILEKKQVHVIVTDMRMPEMGGLELLKTVKEKYPAIVRMVLSGYTQVSTVLTAINQGEIFRFITKPWNLEDEFKPAVLEAVDYYNFQNQRGEKVANTGQNSEEGSEMKEKVLEKSR
ncbi:MAG: response regulator [Sedimentisphaerales bacterium]|nr:response regulator [Sedimentisphaerales bacterium]